MSGATAKERMERLAREFCADWELDEVTTQNIVDMHLAGQESARESIARYCRGMSAQASKEIRSKGRSMSIEDLALAVALEALGAEMAKAILAANDLERRS